MANRDLTTFRSVLPSGEVSQGSNTAEAMLKVTGTIMQRSQEAKINANLSQAQLKLNELDNEYRQKAQGSPFDKTLKQEYQTQRQEMISLMGEDILPAFKGQWVQATQKLTTSSDLSNQNWAYKQAHVNTIQDVNNSIKNNLAGAQQAGRDLALGTDTEVETALNFAPGRAQLEQYALQNLGETDAKKLLADYDNDYVKMVISGAAQENPTFALRLFEQSTVQDALKDDPKFGEFRTAIENQALNFDRVQTNQAKLNILRDESNLLSQSSVTDPISYAELQAEFARQGTPETLQDFFLRANGYKKRKTESTKLTTSQKQQLKVGVYDAIMQLTTAEEMNTEDVESLKNFIFDAADNGALTKAEQTLFLNDLLIPFADQREASLEGFQDNPWLATPEFLGGPADVGFGRIKQYYDENVAIPITIPDEGVFFDGEEVITPSNEQYDEYVTDEERQINTARRLSLYSSFTNKLMDEARTAGLSSITDITNLEDTQRREIYKRAEDYAIEQFANYVFPDMRGKGVPNGGVTPEGRYIPLRTGGTNDVKADVEVNDLEIIERAVQGSNDRVLYYRNATGVIVKARRVAPDGTVLEEEFFTSKGGN